MEPLSLNAFSALHPDLLEEWAQHARQQAPLGRLPTYIPQLAIANPDQFAVQICTVEGQVYGVGDRTLRFPLMSLIKPFLFLYLLERMGLDQVLAHVGVEASDRPFNSLEQLQQDQGFPRNPMINSGAIALSALLPGETPIVACETLQAWLNQQAGCALALDRTMLDSVQSLPNERNRAIAQELFNTDHLGRSMEDALEIYERVCCLAGTVADLAQLGLLLIRPSSIQTLHRRTVQAVMLTCGLYEHSCRFAATVGLPTKSGVSGCTLTVMPGAGAIACYSPPLDATGNSIAGLAFIQSVTRYLDLSVFY